MSHVLGCRSQRAHGRGSVHLTLDRNLEDSAADGTRHGNAGMHYCVCFRKDSRSAFSLSVRWVLFVGGVLDGVMRFAPCDAPGFWRDRVRLREAVEVLCILAYRVTRY